MSVSAGSVQGTAWCSSGDISLDSVDARGGCSDTQHRAQHGPLDDTGAQAVSLFPAEAWVVTPKGKHNEQETRKHVELISSTELTFSH